MFQVGKVGGGHFTLVAPTPKSEGANAPSVPGSAATDLPMQLFNKHITLQDIAFLQTHHCS